MRKFLALTVVILTLLASACSKYKYETVNGDPMNTRIYTLPNGLKVYMSVNKETPRIQTYIAVRVGGKNDPAETTGLAHYFEHLMFKGTPNFGTSDYAAEKPLLDQIEQLFEVYRKTSDEAERAAIYRQIDSISYEASKIAIPNEYDKLMAAIGANGTNAYTSQDMTVYVEDIPSNEVENWARIEADRFRNPVIRGFHTELETIYEEKNMSLTRDSRKVWEALDAALFPHHPYGTQTVLGTQEHLKNPSITNVKNYHKTYYVPNNMAICLSGDLNPDEVIAIIDKYFGDMQPNKNLPKLEIQPEEPITEPIVREVYGLEAANVQLGWRLPGTSFDPNDVAQIAGAILNNGQAGLIDLNLNQQQKLLSAYGGYAGQPDYSTFILGGRPKAGQSLEEVRDLLLGEVAKLRSGDFDEKLIEASINNFKLYMMRELEENDSRADMYVQSFINGTDWADEVQQLDRMSKITKQDIVDWANKYLGEQNYAIVYKRQGEDKNVQKIAAPKITPIVTNRDMQSDFLTEIQNSKVKPIEPVFVDYKTDMSQFDLRDGIHVLYKKNDLNDLFSLRFIFDTGTENDPALGLAFNYLGYLGTEEMTAEQIASEMYAIACSFSLQTANNQCLIAISGLSENMPKALEIVEGLIAGAKGNEEILENLKQDMIKARADAKLNQSQNFAALQRYMFYGKEYIRRTTLTNEQLLALGSEELIARVQDLMNKQHEVLYYGPMAQNQIQKYISDRHKVAEVLTPLEKKHPKMQQTDQSSVILAQYDANQLYYMQFSNRGEAFDVANDPEITLYNEYFGGSMNSICFQEMREARGLAYTASAGISSPVFADDSYGYVAFIATQNDKMKTAVQAFDEIINDMPESEAAFKIAKEAILTRLRTDRTVGADVLSSYLALRRLGLSEDRGRLRFEKIPAMTLEDVKATQQKWVKDRHYTYGILGDIKHLDQNFLKTLGPITTVSQEELFGY